MADTEERKQTIYIKRNFVERIQESCALWCRKARTALEKRAQIIAELTDGFYDPGYGRYHTIHLLSRYIHTVLPYLTLSNPQVQVSTHRAELAYVGRLVEAALNQWLESTRFNVTVSRPLIFNAMIGMGITRVGLRTSGSIEYEGDYVSTTEPYVQVIDDDDFRLDPFAKTIYSAEYMGHVYWARMERAQKMIPNFAKELEEASTLISNTHYLKEHKDLMPAPTTVRRYVKLMDIYLPDEKRIITIFPEGKSRILRSVEWDIEGGPYDILGFEFLPDNTIPIPPLWDLLDLDKALNTVLAKARAQAERQKDIIVAEPEARDDAKRLLQVPDGGFIEVDLLDKVKPISVGGANPAFASWASLIINQFSRQAGNIDLLGGIQPASETLGQDQLLLSTATKRIDEMLSLVCLHHKSILVKVLGLVWDDPLFIARRVVPVSGIGDVTVEINNLIEHGALTDLVLDIEVYSVTRFSPIERRNALLQLLNGVIIPLMPLAQQQGLALDVERILGKLASYYGFDLEGLLTRSVPKPEMPYRLIPPNQPSQGGKEKKLPASVQGDNRFGASLISREANSASQQLRTLVEGA